MHTMALKENTSRRVYTQNSRSELQITGHFWLRGPQFVGGEGGCPMEIADLLDKDPSITAIAVVRDGGGEVYQQMKQD